MPRAGRWLEEAGGSRGDGSNDVQDLSTMGHVVVVGSPYHNGQHDERQDKLRTKPGPTTMVNSCWVGSFRTL